MTNHNFVNDTPILQEENSLRRPKLRALMHSDINVLNNNQDDHDHNQEYYVHRRPSNASFPSPPLYDTPTSSPYIFSPWNNPISPYTKSPWIQSQSIYPSKQLGLIGSLEREEGHIYSLATSNNLLFTGSDSKNIHVWSDMHDYSGFKSRSGFVKAIIVSGKNVFTGHHDGKIRIWRNNQKQKPVYKRIGNLPTTKDYLKSSMNPKNYVEVRRRRNVPWNKHFDAVSCMSLDVEHNILYSGSWDKTVKVWRLTDFKCMESVNAHDDAVNSVAASYGGLVFTGSADGTVKMWRREFLGKVTRHVLVETLLKQDSAVTAVAAAREVIYSGASDGLVSYWLREKQSLSYGGALRGHKLAVLCLAVAGSLVVSGSADQSICVWRREARGDHTCLTVLMGHTGPVKCLAIEEEREGDEVDEGISSDDDQRWRVYSGSLDKSVKVWRLSDHAPDLKHFVRH